MDFCGQIFELLVFEQMPNFSSNQLAEIDCNNYRERREGEKRKGKSFAPSKRKIEMKENSLKNKSFQKVCLSVEALKFKLFLVQDFFKKTSPLVNYGLLKDLTKQLR
jgi:hypothetical protein